MAYQVFIDGAEGTTGLKIHEYFENRSDVNVIQIKQDRRKDIEERLEMIRSADVSFLCLPDSAAKEIAALAPEDSKIIDTSTAHRTDDAWVYGLPELSGQREKIKNSSRVANPGCHATGFILLVRPLVEEGIIEPDYPLAATSVTGYSGGGKKMIALHRSEDRQKFLRSPGQYSLTQTHKHIPEMKLMTGINTPPAFSPIVGDYYSGMVVSVPLHAAHMKRSLGTGDLRRVFEEYYSGERLVKVEDYVPGDGFIHGAAMAGKNDAEIYVFGNEERPLLVIRFDNLGKGASGASVQNMNIMLGIDETKGLI